MENPSQEHDFASVKARLDEIVKAVSDEELPLDDALKLYEEAVSLGLQVSDLLEDGIDPDSEEAQETEAALSPADDGDEGVIGQEVAQGSETAVSGE